MLSRSLVYGINVNFSSISGKKELFWRSAKVDVLLSELNALSECHPLSEASTRLADRRNLEGNLSRRNALNASSAHSASCLSPSRLRTSLALSESSLTRAKHENGAKHDVKVSEPFFQAWLADNERGLERALNSCKSLKSEIHRGKEQSKEAQVLIF